MKETTYGYFIDDDVLIDIKQGVVARLYSSRKLQFYTAEAIFLGETSMRLFVYLLERSERDVVPYTDILYEIWDKRGLVSSHKRLSQTVTDLRGKLKSIGLMDEFILTVRGKGYRLNHANVKRLYSKSIMDKKRNKRDMSC